MKKCLALTSTLLLLTQAANADLGFSRDTRSSSGTRYSGSDNVATHSEDLSQYDVSSTDVQCNYKRKYVPYSLINDIAVGGIQFSKTSDEVIVEIPSYLTMCMKDIGFDAKVYNNDIYLSFFIEPGSELSNVEVANIPSAFEKCVKENYSDIISNENPERRKEYTKRNKFKRKVPIKVDPTRTSEVIIASPTNTDSYQNDVYTSLANGRDLFSRDKINKNTMSQCFKYELPTKEPFMANEGLAYEAIQLCKDPDNVSLADIDAQLDKLTKEGTAGNFRPLIQTLKQIKMNLIQTEARQTLDRLAEIEEEITSGDDDESNRKELAKEYAELVAKFGKSYGPAIADELKELFTKRASANEDDKKEIDEKVKKLNLLAGEFARHESDNVDIYKEVESLLKDIYMDKGSEKLIIGLKKGVALASDLSKVYVGKNDDDDRGERMNLGPVLANLKKNSKGLDKYQSKAKAWASTWRGERASLKGDKRYISRSRGKITSLQKQIQQSQRNFQTGAQAEYKAINERLYSTYVKPYCSGIMTSSKYENCNWGKNMYQTVMGQYNQDLSRRYSEFKLGLQNNELRQLSMENYRYKRYQDLYQQGEVNRIQERYSQNRTRDGYFDQDSYDIWAPDYEYSAYGSGVYDFGMDPMFNMRAPAGTTGAQPSGSGQFANPYFIGPRN